MSQKERDRLKVLHETSKGQLTQKQAVGQLKVSERQVRRMLKQLKISGDSAVIHALRGRQGNRRISEAVQERAVGELRRVECADFGPTFAAEYLRKRLEISIGKDTVRRWMTTAGLWKPRQRKLETIHQWRQRRSCAGELVQWDTSVHNWLEGRGERLYLIPMIADATSRVFARFVRQDTAEENLRVLWGYLQSYGRPLAFYTDKAAMFEVTPKQAADKDGQEMARPRLHGLWQSWGSSGSRPTVPRRKAGLNNFSRRHRAGS